MSSCANTMDIVEGEHPLGVFEPKNDYVVDIPMKSQTIQGQSKGFKIFYLNCLTFGGNRQAQGVVLGSRGENTLRDSQSSVQSGSGSVASTIVNLGGTLVTAAAAPLSGTSTIKRFKQAALRSACDANNCDVIGYPMYNVDLKDYILWQTYKVNVKGFPGKVQGVETVPRKYKVEDSYWRRSLSNPSPAGVSAINREREARQLSKFNAIEKRADELMLRLKALEENQTHPVNLLSRTDSDD